MTSTAGLALLFPGQGSQHPDMLPWLEQEPEAQPVLAQMARILGKDWRSRLGDREWATCNRIAQPLLIGLELAAWSSLVGKLPPPATLAGYSVGELAAFCAAGAFDRSTALDLAERRAAAMDRSAGDQPTGMLAVGDLPLRLIRTWCERHELFIAIRLGAHRAIVGGSAAALRLAARDPSIASGHLSPIGVRVASHTPLMQGAALEFAATLAEVSMAAPRCPIVCNRTGAATRNRVSLADCLATQLDHPVLWDACMEAVSEHNITCVLEVGPGTTLSTLWRASYPGIPVRSIDEFRSADAVCTWANKVLADEPR